MTKIKSLPQKNILLKNARATLKAIFLREYFFLPPKKKFKLFFSTLQCFIFFATLSRHDKKLKSTVDNVYNIRQKERQLVTAGLRNLRLSGKSSSVFQSNFSAG